MKITVVTVRRVFNLGNYQSATYEATAEVGDGESPAAVGEILKGYVYTRGGDVNEGLNCVDRAAVLQRNWTPPDGYYPVDADGFVRRSITDLGLPQQ